MTLPEYHQSFKINQLDLPFYSLILAAFCQADMDNLVKLQEAWPAMNYSVHEYAMSRRVGHPDPPFFALIMAAIRQADNTNMDKIQAAWPEIYSEFLDRYSAPLGVVEDRDGFSPAHYHRMINPVEDPDDPSPAEEALSYLEESEDLTQEDWTELTDLLNERRSHE